MALSKDGHDFAVYHDGGLTLLSNNRWRGEGFLHGMTTTELSFSQADRPVCAQKLCEVFGADRLLLLRQVHGRAIIDSRSGLSLEQVAGDSSRYVSYIGEADAMVLPSEQPIRGKRLVFGVLTADCVPIVLRSSHGVALIHAGWRGLAQGIIQATAEVLGDVSDGAIFACAGGERYEVGLEVIRELGSSAVFSSAAMPEKFLLDTAGTAMIQLRRAAPKASFLSAQICTISDPRFHSFRRDGDRAGRCLTFVRPPDAK